MLKDQRILIIGPNSDRGGQTTFWGLVNACREIGISYITLTPQSTFKSIKIYERTIKEFAPTFILVLGCIPSHPTFRNLPCPIVCWNSEEVRLQGNLYSLKTNYEIYDWIFHWDESALHLYDFWGAKKVSFLPQGFCPYQHTDMKQERQPHIQFIGSREGVHGNRNHLFYLLKKEKIPFEISSGFDYKENSLLYSRAAYSINLGMNCHHFLGDSFRAFGFQQRIFESLGSNCPVITNIPEEYPQKNSIKGLIPKANILFYTKDTLFDVCRDALKDFNETGGLARFTPKYRDDHTYRKRLEAMYDKLVKESIL